MVATGKKRTARYLQGDRFRGPSGEGTVTSVKKGTFPYEITWWNGRSEIYSAEQIERYGYQYLPPDSGVEDIEEEEVGLFDGDFSDSLEKSIAPKLTWKDWVKGDRVCSEKNGKHGVVEKIKFRPQSVFILWDGTAETIEYSPADLELLEITLGLASASEDFSRDQRWEVGDHCTLIPDNSRSAAEQWQPGELIVVEVNGQNIKVQSVENPDIQSVIFSKFLQPCSDNLTSAQASESDSPLQDSGLEILPLKDSVKSTITAEISSPSDTQKQSSSATSSSKTGTILKEDPTSLQLPLLANLSQSKESDLPPTTPEIVSPVSLKRSPKSNRRTSRSKTSKACFHAHIDLEANSDTLEVSCPTFPSAGTMSSGSWSGVDTLDRPFLESGCSWLESPSGLSAVGRVPGQSRLEAQLKSEQHLEEGQCINPAFLEDAFEIPLGWCDRLVSLSAIQLLEESEKRSETVLTPELQPSPSVECSISIPSEKTEEELTPVDDPSVIGRHYWCDRHTVTVTLETLHNWRETPRSPEIIRAARCRPWWQKDRWGNDFPTIMVLRLDELVEVEKLSCLMEENPQIPVRPITGISQDSCPDCSRELKSPDSGCGNCGWNMPLVPAPNPPFWKIGDRYRRRDRDDVCIIEVTDLKPGSLKIKTDAIHRWFAHDELKGWADNLRRLPGGRSLPHSLEKPETQTTKQAGSLYQYTANKADKLGNISTYPKVEGDRLREEDAHWYWGFSYVEKQNGTWRDKSAAVPRKKLSEVRGALRSGKNYTYILQQVLGKD